jgi:hypothetical protein
MAGNNLPGSHARANPATLQLPYTMNGFKYLIQLLFILCQNDFVLLQRSSGESQLAITGPVKVWSSPTFDPKKFDTRLAVQADTNNVASNCFLSEKQKHPWFRLELKSSTGIFNVRLGVIDQSESDGELPSDYTLRGMTNLSVYVGNSTNDKTNDAARCGGPWAYRESMSIDLDCKGSLTGKYVYVVVPSSSPTYLAICSIVLNREEGKAYFWLVDEVHVLRLRSAYTCIYLFKISPTVVCSDDIRTTVLPLQSKDSLYNGNFVFNVYVNIT